MDFFRSLVVVLLVFASLRVNATCDQFIDNRMNHHDFGPVNAYVVSSKANGAGWNTEPTNLLYNQSVHYSVSHHYFGLGNLHMSVDYQLIPDNQPKPFANVTIWTACNERSDKTEVYLSNCTVLHGPPTFCHDLGFTNVSCAENGVINNENLYATLTADGQGFQHNDFICTGNSFSEQRFNPMHCLNELHLTKMVQNLVNFHDSTEKIMNNLTSSLKEDLAESKNIIKEVKLLTETAEVIKQLIYALEKQVKSKPNSLALKAKLMEQKNKLELQNEKIKKLQDSRVDLTIKFQEKNSLMLDAKEKMKNSFQAIRNVKKFLHENYCGNEIAVVSSLLSSVSGLLTEINEFKQDHGCSILYYSMEAFETALDHAITFLPAVGPAIWALQHQPNCRWIKPGTIIPSMKITVTGLIHVIVETICNLNNLLPSPVMLWVENHFCKASKISGEMIAVIMDTICGDFGVYFTHMFVAPAICPLEINGASCRDKLGDEFCWLHSPSSNTTSS